MSSADSAPDRLDAVRTAATSPVFLALVLVGVLVAVAAVVAVALALLVAGHVASAVLQSVAALAPPVPHHPLLAPFVLLAMLGLLFGAAALYNLVVIFLHGVAAVAWAPFKGLAAARLGRALRGERSASRGSDWPSRESVGALARWGWMKAKSARYPVLPRGYRPVTLSVPIASEWRDGSDWHRLLGCSGWRLRSGFLSLALALDGQDSVRDAAAASERRVEAMESDQPSVRAVTFLGAAIALLAIGDLLLVAGATTAVTAVLVALAAVLVLVPTAVLAVDLAMRTHQYVALDEVLDDGDGTGDDPTGGARPTSCGSMETARAHGTS